MSDSTKKSTDGQMGAMTMFAFQDAKAAIAMAPRGYLTPLQIEQYCLGVMAKHMQAELSDSDPSLLFALVLRVQSGSGGRHQNIASILWGDVSLKALASGEDRLGHVCLLGTKSFPSKQIQKAKISEKQHQYFSAFSIALIRTKIPLEHRFAHPSLRGGLIRIYASTSCNILLRAFIFPLLNTMATLGQDRCHRFYLDEDRVTERAPGQHRHTEKHLALGRLHLQLFVQGLVLGEFSC